MAIERGLLLLDRDADADFVTLQHWRALSETSAISDNVIDVASAIVKIRQCTLYLVVVVVVGSSSSSSSCCS